MAELALVLGVAIKTRLCFGVAKLVLSAHDIVAKIVLSVAMNARVVVGVAKLDSILCFRVAELVLSVAKLVRTAERLF